MDQVTGYLGPRLGGFLARPGDGPQVLFHHGKELFVGRAITWIGFLDQSPGWDMCVGSRQLLRQTRSW